MSDGNNVIPFDKWAPLPAEFKGIPFDVSHYTAGIGQSWPILTIKGKTWGTRFRGENKQVLAPNEQAGGALMPVQFLDVVVIETAKRISKVYYKGGFVDGDHTPPDCWSADGITPDEGASDKQAGTCRGCKHNVMNSRVAEGTNGVIVKGKACSDNKRLAVVSLHDIPSKPYDGMPLMLRLSPTSFTNYSQYVNSITSRGYPLFAVAVRLTFDHTVAHPKVQFMPIRVLTAQEATQVVELRKNPMIEDMLNDKTVGAFADPDAGSEGEAEELPQEKGSLAAGWGKLDPKPEPEPERKVTTYVAQPMNLKPDALEILTAEKRKIADLEARLAAAEKAAEPEPPPPVLTPEQMKIKELEAKLAEAEGKKARGRPRSKPVAPPTSTVAANPVTPAGNGAEETPTKLGNALADRIADIAGENQ